MKMIVLLNQAPNIVTTARLYAFLTTNIGMGAFKSSAMAQ